MARKEHRHKNRQQRPGVSDCLGCGADVETAMQSLEASDGMSGGWFPLCRPCYEYYCRLPDAAARDFFVGCLTQDLFKRLAL